MPNSLVPWAEHPEGVGQNFIDMKFESFKTQVLADAGDIFSDYTPEELGRVFREERLRGGEPYYTAQSGCQRFAWSWAPSEGWFVDCGRGSHGRGESLYEAKESEERKYYSPHA